MTNQIHHTEEINWRNWHEDIFSDSAQENKPILLALTATWCHWCHVMDQTSYSQPEIINFINTHFIPARVDVDIRPDLARKYNQGGFPSLAVLNNKGNLLLGKVYSPPEELAILLEQVKTNDSNPVVNERLRNLSNTFQTPPDNDANLLVPHTRVLKRIQGTYDPIFGGLGDEPKQPPWQTISLLMNLYSRTGDKELMTMVTTTLDGIHTGLFDANDLGFFRYSVSRDWKVPHYEKMLVTNANLAITFSEAHQVTRKSLYKKAALGTVDYLVNTLYDSDKGGFYASQDAEETYYQLPWKDRALSIQPSIDKTLYSGWNSLAAIALLKCFNLNRSSSHKLIATQIINSIWQDSWKGAAGLSHLIGQPLDQPPFLDDHVYFLRANLALYESTGDEPYLERAVEILQATIDLFKSGGNGFYDVSHHGFKNNHLETPDIPILENSLLAESMITIYYLTGDQQYNDLAGSTLNTFNQIVPGKSFIGDINSRRMEEDEEVLFLPAGSAWGRAYDMFANAPIHCILTGYASSPLFKRMDNILSGIYAPHKITERLDINKNKNRIAKLGFPARSYPELYVCIGDQCLAPIHTVAEIKNLREKPPWATA